MYKLIKRHLCIPWYKKTAKTYSDNLDNINQDIYFPHPETKMNSVIANDQIEQKYENILFTRFSEPEPDPYKVLVLGEKGVGKTAFINGLYELVSGTPQSFNEFSYIPSKRVYTKYIPSIDMETVDVRTTIENIRNRQFSPEISTFILKPHGRIGSEFRLLQNYDLEYTNIPKYAVFKEILISEFPADSTNFPANFLDHFDKVVIMCEYSDITTIRSIQYWAELIQANRNKIIICVNKCDVSPNSYVDDFQSRKATILKHYTDNCFVEFISVKTNANMTFLYKYL
jgi:GTPase SAR1 family protein